MHEDNISLLCNEADRLIKINIQLLEKMINEPDILIDDKKNDGQPLFNKEKAIKRIEELRGEQIKITRKEMVLAVVGTMKAGKSTTINAIVGKEILPNRNRPMTSIPTLIRHVPGKIAPSLTLNNIEPIHKLISDLNKKIKTSEGKKRLDDLKKDQEKVKLLDIIKNDSWLTNNYSGESGIYTCLSSLNDLVRLASSLGVEFPFSSYEAINELPVIEVEFSHLELLDENQGILTLLDTPGPNEAGQPQLQVMMKDQLQKASAVLAVLDYTQLNSEADKQVRQELNNIADVAAGRLFVLVNKFDQKDRNGDDADTVKSSVPAMLKNGMLTSEHVYPGSARQAYLANRARNVVSQDKLLPEEEAWVKDFAALAFGSMFDKDDLEDKDEVLKRANRIWQKSYFDKLIEEVVKAAHAKAAALAVDSAAAKLVQNAENTNEYLSIRHQGLNISIKALKSQIDGLKHDIEEIQTCHKRVSDEVNSSMNLIKIKTSELLHTADKALKDQLDEYFKTGRRKEKEEFELNKTAVHTSQPKKQSGFFNMILSGLAGIYIDSRTEDFNPTENEVKFNNRSDAEEFVSKIESSVSSLLSDIESVIKPTLVDIVSSIEKSFQNNTLSAIDNIARQINSRLENDGFTVKIKFPEVKNLQVNIATKTRISSMLEERTSTETRRRRASGAWGTICGWLNTDDWGWEEYDVSVTRSIVNIRKIEKAVKSQTQQHFNELNQSIEDNINQPIMKEIESFFALFKVKVEQLRNTLIQSSEDHKNSQHQQELLTKRLLELKKMTPDIIKDSKSLQEDLGPIL
ncbi:dynamin family protein [Providencia sp. PROV033]|uniref:dynamin family protein n=1 Tax=Providencia sp. PROV033 TaxID=2949765 RepID=UPI00234AA634|nr:dynamin family protein [Providencia sp. PROV033]